MTRIFAAYDAAFATVAAAVPAGVTVLDGPQPVMPTDPRLVLFGVADPMTAGMVTGVDMGVQDWADLGAYAKTEQFVISSTLIVWSGSTDLAPLRADAAAIIASIEDAVRLSHARTGDLMNGAPALAFGAEQFGAGPYDLNGGALGPTGWANFEVTHLQQIQTSVGGAVHVGFAIACQAQI